MDPRVLLIEGYKLYKFPITPEQFADWVVLDPTQPAHLKKDCVISSLAFLGLEERGKAEEIARRVNRIEIDDVIRRGVVPKESGTDYVREKFYEHDLLETEKKFQMLFETYSIPQLIDSNFSIIDLLLDNNEGTLFNCHRLTHTPRRQFLLNDAGEILGGHQMVMAKGADGELVIIEAQCNPIVIISGKVEIRDYFLQQRFSHYNLYFKGPRGKNPGNLLEEDENTKKGRSMFPSLRTVRYQMGRTIKKTITKKNYRNRNRNRARGLNKTKKRKQKKKNNNN